MCFIISHFFHLRDCFVSTGIFTAGISQNTPLTFPVMSVRIPLVYLFGFIYVWFLFGFICWLKIKNVSKDEELNYEQG